MASVQTSSYQGRYLKLTVVEESTSIENNTSTLRWTLESIGGSANFYTIYNWGVWVNGQEIYKSQTTKWGSYAFPAATGSRTGTITVPHNADGTASDVGFTLKGSVYSNRDNTYNGSVSLSTIPRTSNVSLSSTSLTTNSSVTIDTNRASSSFTHTIAYTFGNTSGTIATGVGASVDWTPPRDLARQTPNSQNGSGSIYCKTFNGSTEIGTSSVGFTLSIDGTIKPSISSSSTSDGNSTVSSKKWGTLLVGLSYLQIALEAAGSYGSTISKYYCTYEGVTYEDTSITSLNNKLKTLPLVVGNRSCTMWVSDSRGKTSDKLTKSYTVTAYSSPSISVYDVERCSSDGTLSDNGTYLKISFAGGISSVNNKNKLTAKVGYKLKTSDTYTYVTYVNASTTVNTINYTDSNTKIIGDGKINPDHSYDIIFIISDEFYQNTRDKDVSTGFDLIHYNKSGKAIAFGKKSEASENESKAEFGFDVDIKGALYINGVKMIWYE